MAGTAGRERYLVWQKRKAWARFRVPDDVRDEFDGKREVWVRLNTDDRKLAQARVSRAASDFRARVLEARGRSGTVEEDALMWRREIEQGKADGPEGASFDDVVTDMAVKQAAERYVNGGYKAVTKAARLFHDDDEVAALAELGGPKAKTFVDIALAGKTPLLPFVEPWSAVRVNEVEKKTADMDAVAVRRFVDAFPLLHSVSRGAVAGWIEKRKQEVSANTVQREVTGIRSFWGYLRSREEVSADAPDPFSNLRYKTRAKDAAKVSLANVVEAGQRAGMTAEQAQASATAAYEGYRRQAEAAARSVGVAQSDMNALWSWAAETYQTEHAHSVLSLVEGGGAARIKDLARKFAAYRRGNR